MASIMKTGVTGAMALATSLLGATVAEAADTRVEAGKLECHVEGGVGLILGSSRDMTCTFNPLGGGQVEHYTGEVDKFGVDIGWTEESVILWGVYAPTSKVGRGALAGQYGGASAEVAAGYGLGANALVGGSDKSVFLQPLSVEGVKGVNVAAGVSIITLKAR